LLGEREQDTGLAPTDDSFTVITTMKGVEGYNQVELILSQRSCD
jgi:hypothetical protein